jgi:hypothetical protein
MASFSPRLGTRREIFRFGTWAGRESRDPSNQLEPTPALARPAHAGVGRLRLRAARSRSRQAGERNQFGSHHAAERLGAVGTCQQETGQSSHPDRRPLDIAPGAHDIYRRQCDGTTPDPAAKLRQPLQILGDFGQPHADRMFSFSGKPAFSNYFRERSRAGGPTQLEFFDRPPRAAKAAMTSWARFYRATSALASRQAQGG